MFSIHIEVEKIVNPAQGFSPAELDNTVAVPLVNLRNGIDSERSWKDDLTFMFIAPSQSGIVASYINSDFMFP